MYARGVWVAAHVERGPGREQARGEGREPIGNHALINQLLDVSRIQAGRLSVEPRPTDLVAIAREVVTRHSEQAPPAQVRLSTGAAILVGLWDPERLDQVLDNLVGNAVKYGQGRPVDVSVRSRGAQAIIEVTDRGIGIPPAAQERIFERFERAASSSDYGGLGLGLWIARQLVEASGGRIEVTSEPGKGSTFTVVLPIGR